MVGRTRVLLSGTVLLFGALPAAAQQTAGGQVAASAAGQVGQRQTREAVANIEPMARIDSRIQNRIQSRLRTRVDRDYSPEANAISPFETAADRARTAGRIRRR